MAGKKKKAASNPARGFTTTSIASKSKQDSQKAEREVEDKEKARGSAKEHLDASSDGATITTSSNPMLRMSPEDLEKHLEEHELQALIDVSLEKAKKVSSKEISKINHDRKVSRKQANPFYMSSWFSQQTLNIVLNLCRSDQFEWQTLTGRGQTKQNVSEDDMTMNLWSLQQVLRDISVDESSIHDILVKLCKLSPNSSPETRLWGLKESLDWLAVKNDPLSTTPYDRDAPVDISSRNVSARREVDKSK